MEIDEFDQTKLVLYYKAFKVLFREYIYAITWSFCKLLSSSYTEAKKDVKIGNYL